MKTAIFVAILVVTSIASAKADGFKCEGVNTGINVKVFNHTQPTDGTRSSAVMIVSDQKIHSPNKTIALFTDENKTLAYKGYGLFSAKVDLRFIESNKKGENIAGTKLGQLKNINLQLKNFVYSEPFVSAPTKDGEILDAKLSYIKRNGEVLEEKAICERYKKN